ncbi:MAG: hypothetical protein JKY48_03385 [Flavobacteriales bacterium]|nr:hypothetical protein [Flavobacteriales bacterium]
MPLGSMIGAAGGLMSSGFQNNPYDQGINTYQQFPGQAHQFLDPYLQAGRQAIPEYEQQINQGIHQPWQLQDNIMGHYQQSPWAQEQMRATGRAMNNAAVAGGSLGSPNENLAMQERMRGIVSQDQQQYYQNSMEPYRMGMQGLQFGVGMGNRTGMYATGMAQQYLQNMAKMRMAQTGFENRQTGEGISGVTGIAGGFM